MSLPAKMRAVEISKPGGPEVLRIGERPLPQPKPHEILVRVAAAGVNRPDVLQRMGLYAVPPDASDLPGLEIAGTVASVGAGVKMWKVGEQVCALVHGGGYAEYCVVPEVQALPVPKGLTLTEAASLPETFFTVYSNVFDRGGLKPGETFLVQGGSSGIGVTAIQMVSAMGNRVFATASAMGFLAGTLSFGAQQFLPLQFQDANLLSPTKAGLWLSPIMGGIMIGSALGGRLISAAGRYRVFPIMIPPMIGDNQRPAFVGDNRFAS